MRTILCGLVVGAIAVAAAADDLAHVLDAMGDEHPRLFLSAGDLPALKQKTAADARLQAVADFIVASATHLHDEPALKREKVGKRLLGVSRECLRRVTYLAYAYHATGDAAHLQRAEAEMLAAARFEDWNPSHFLDVAEMTAALAIGYDWLHNDLSEASRETIREAIVEKGLKTSLAGGWWVTTTNNWNQVCHGGLSLGALAVAEHEPDLANQIIARAIKYLPRAMHEYEPDGVYPEGPSYWSYGTTYNVLLIDALEHALGTSFGLAEAQGFLKSPAFFRNATGPTGLFYNFSDCGTRGGISSAMFWFAAREDAPALLWHEMRKLQEFADESPAPDKGGDRMLVFSLIWAPPLKDAPRPASLHWKGDGPTPIALHRSGWGENDTFAGVKGGSPSTNHAHMDIGSFVIDMNGVRWAVDLGAQSYNSLESKGISLWGKKQDSERWTVFRLNNFSHNTLVVDGQLQRVDGKAPIIRHSSDAANPFTIVDMGTVYDGQLAAAHRGLTLLGDAVLIQDELSAPDQVATVRWAMATRAGTVNIAGNTATLEADGKTATLQVLSPVDARLELLDVSKPTNDYDAENAGVRMITFEKTLPASSQQTIAVVLSPGSDGHDAPPMKALSAW